MRNLCFRPEQTFLDRLENYMAIHHIEDKSEAMRQICEEWITLKHDIETYKDLVKKLSKKKVESPKPQTCMMGKTFESKQAQDSFCLNVCRNKTPTTYLECQSRKGGST